MNRILSLPDHGQGGRRILHPSTTVTPAGRILRHGLTFAGFLAFFLVLLSPIPRSGSMLGSVDSLFVPVLSNTYMNQIEASLTGAPLGRAMVPANMTSYTETILGIAAIFMTFRWVGLTDVVAQYLTQVVQLSLMAYSVYLLGGLYTRSRAGAILAGFAFTTSNYLWADIDHLMIHFYFLPTLCLYFLLRAIQAESPRYLLAAGILGGLQMYFSVQVFFYQSLMVLIVAGVNLHSLRSFSRGLLARSVGAYLLLALPLLLFYLNTVVRLGVVNPFPTQEYFSLQLADLASTLPGKLLNYGFVSTSLAGWHRVSHSAFPGLALPSLALAGVLPLSRRKLELVAIAAVGILFALGSTVQLGGTRIDTPLALFFRWVPLASYLRVGHRSFSLVILALSLLAGIGLDRISAQAAKIARPLPFVVALGTLLFVAAENISWPLNRYEVIPYPAIPEGYREFFEDKPWALILDLPSHSTSWPSYIDDIIYVLWQTQHRRSIVGGVAGYFPPSRLATQRNTYRLPSTEAFRYFSDLGVTHLVWHDSPYLVCHPAQTDYGCDPMTGARSAAVETAFPWLETTPFLELVYRNDLIRVYELRRQERLH